MGIKDSIWGALGLANPKVTREDTIRLRNIMLAELGRYDITEHPALFMKIYGSQDVENLWYLRSDLLVALQSTLGETEARERMDAITDAFVGYHPAAKKRKFPR